MDRVIIRLNSTAINEKTGKKTGHFYTTTRAKRTSGKLKKMMYDPIARQHVEYVEAKV